MKIIIHSTEEIKHAIKVLRESKIIIPVNNGQGITWELKFPIKLFPDSITLDEYLKLTKDVRISATQ